MQPLHHLGSALRQLRELAGLGIDACASKVNLSSDELNRAEQGFLDTEVIERLAAFFEMEREELESGALVPAQAHGTVFLLQGSYQDFDAEDLAVLCAAMNEGRLISALDGATASYALRRRLQFMPHRVAGPTPRDAALQGYKFARLVRSRLGLGADPIGDIGALLEETLGIAVCVDKLVSNNLRAASIVDPARAAAAAVLAASSPDRERNPVLARVYLAHELGHVLFDPAAPGTVRLALEDLSIETRSTGRRSDDALLESRAKGFAAELLLPFEGLRMLLGPPQQTLDIGEANTMVTRVRETFGTPLEIATWHLMNLRFLHPELLWKGALHQPSLTNRGHETRLPGAGEGSLRLRSLVAGGHAGAAKDAADVLASRARESAAHVSAALLDEVLEKALVAARDKRVIEATDLLAEQLDDLLLANELTLARALLDRVDPHHFPPPVLTGLLTVVSHAPGELDRSDFWARVRNALRTTWTWDESRMASLESRLR